MLIRVYHIVSPLCALSRVRGSLLKYLFSTYKKELLIEQVFGKNGIVKVLLMTGSGVIRLTYICIFIVRRIIVLKILMTQITQVIPNVVVTNFNMCKLIYFLVFMCFAHAEYYAKPSQDVVLGLKEVRNEPIYTDFSFRKELCSDLTSYEVRALINKLSNDKEIPFDMRRFLKKLLFDHAIKVGGMSRKEVNKYAMSYFSFEFSMFGRDLKKLFVDVKMFSDKFGCIGDSYVFAMYRKIELGEYHLEDEYLKDYEKFKNAGVEGEYLRLVNFNYYSKLDLNHRRRYLDEYIEYISEEGYILASPDLMFYPYVDRENIMQGVLNEKFIADRDFFNKWKRGGFDESVGTHGDPEKIGE